MENYFYYKLLYYYENVTRQKKYGPGSSPLCAIPYLNY